MADTRCSHDEIETTVRMVEMADTGQRIAEVLIRCVDCDRPFLFGPSLQVGVDMTGAAVSPDRTELRVAVVAPLSVPGTLDD